MEVEEGPEASRSEQQGAPPSRPDSRAAHEELARRPRPKQRIRGVDAARALAIVGMVMVHFGGDADGSDFAELVYGSTHGRAAILFGVLAGVGVSLLAGDRSPERLGLLYRKLALRGAVLLPLGLLLQGLPHGIAVILQFYAVYFTVGAVAASLPDRWLLAASGAVLALGPVVIIGAQLRWPSWFEAAPTTLADISQPALIVRELLLSGNYPVVTWSAPVLFGVWLGRRDLRSTAVRWAMIVGGLGAAATAYLFESLALRWLELPDDVGWAQLVITYPHSQMGPWLVQATGFAVAALGVCLIACDALPRLTRPAVVVGQMALSVYVGHLLLLAAWPELFFRETVDGAVYSVARFVLLTTLAALGWRAIMPRGPLELLLDLPWRPRKAV